MRLTLLDLPEIGMEPLIEKLAAMRLAPLQCAMWGHPGDDRIADD